MIEFYTNKNYRNYLAYKVDKHMGKYDDSFKLKIFDNNIFNCSHTLNNRIKLIKINDLDIKIIEVENIYNNPYAIRNLIKETPHVLNRQVNTSAYPGFVSSLNYVDLTDLESILNNIISKYYKDIEFKNKIEKMSFSTGIYNRSMICSENQQLLTHKDFDNGIAGVIYFNTEDEYDGGTSFHYDEKENYKLAYLHKMKFNTMILYPSDTYHSIFIENSDSFIETYRITQRFFIR